MARTATSAAPTLDLAGTAAPGRQAALLARFDALAPGSPRGVFEALAWHDLLEALQRERRGLFEWTPGGSASGAEGIEVLRRDAAPGSPRGVFEALAWDHDRLDTLDRGCFDALAAGNLATARALFADFARGLGRHIRFEEEILFPAVEAKAGFTTHAGPTAVMRAEHVEIRSCLAGITAALAADGAGAAQIRSRLADVLGGHNVKEERILYPLADRLLGAGGADALVAEIQRLV
jgi:regulator of cell morphogenesis and NO signaling